MNKKEKKNLIIFGIIVGVILVLGLLSIIITVPYKAYETYSEEEPYEDIEYYYEKEPYTVPYRECTKHSWWTGKCTEYDTFYKTEYRDVKKSRTITKYRTVGKVREVTRHCNLWKKVIGRCPDEEPIEIQRDYEETEEEYLSNEDKCVKIYFRCIYNCLENYQSIEAIEKCGNNICGPELIREGCEETIFEENKRYKTEIDCLKICEFEKDEKTEIGCIKNCLKDI